MFLKKERQRENGLACFIFGVILVSKRNTDLIISINTYHSHIYQFGIDKLFISNLFLLS